MLYDLQKDNWNIYDIEQATIRISPNSTYKIYDALFALEENIITSENLNHGMKTKLCFLQ